MGLSMRRRCRLRRARPPSGPPGEQSLWGELAWSKAGWAGAGTLIIGMIMILLTPPSQALPRVLLCRRYLDDEPGSGRDDTRDSCAAGEAHAAPINFVGRWVDGVWMDAVESEGRGLPAESGDSKRPLDLTLSQMWQSKVAPLRPCCEQLVVFDRPWGAHAVIIIRASYLRGIVWCPNGHFWSIPSALPTTGQGVQSRLSRLRAR